MEINLLRSNASTEVTLSKLFLPFPITTLHWTPCYIKSNSTYNNTIHNQMNNIYANLLDTFPTFTQPQIPDCNKYIRRNVEAGHCAPSRDIINTYEYHSRN
jgi:hypothetical protein